MVLGMPLSSFTLLHVIFSIVELIAGTIVVLKMVNGSRSRFNGLFLLTATLTTFTGFLFPNNGITPGLVLGFISVPFLLLAAATSYTGYMLGVGRVIYVLSTLILLYLDAFVAVAQSFLKIPALHDLAPTGKEAPFIAAQGLLLLVFIVIGFLALKRFRPAVVVIAA